jgi:hypothetical protein
MLQFFKLDHSNWKQKFCIKMSSPFTYLVFRDLTRNFVETRSRYVKPAHAPVASYEEIDDDDIPLTYENKKMEDIELGDSTQFGSQPPEWLMILQAVQRDMENIKVNMQKLNALHESHTTFKVKKNASEEERKIEIQTQEIKRVSFKIWRY